MELEIKLRMLRALNDSLASNITRKSFLIDIGLRGIKICFPLQLVRTDVQRTEICGK